MNTLLRAIVATSLVVAFPTMSGAQDVNYPGKPTLHKHTSGIYKVSVGFPKNWALNPPLRNEIWLSVGELRGKNAACFVRMSEVENLRLSKPENFFAQMDEKAWIKLTSAGMPDVKTHLYDLAYLSGRKARRVVYSGTDSGVKIGSVFYQALDGDRIFTVGCLSEIGVFQTLFNDFEAVISSFRFER